MHNQFKPQKFKHLMLAMGPRDLNSAPYSPVHCSSHSMTSFQSSELTELPVVENGQLFAQRAHSARTAHGTPPLGPLKLGSVEASGLLVVASGRSLLFPGGARMVRYCAHSEAEMTVASTRSPLDRMYVTVMPAGSHQRDRGETARGHGAVCAMAWQHMHCTVERVGASMTWEAGFSFPGGGGHR